MFVAQITEKTDRGLHNEMFQLLVRLFPEYIFSIMMGPSPFVIARPHPDTILDPSDEASEAEMLRHIVTELLAERLGAKTTDAATSDHLPSFDRLQDRLAASDAGDHLFEYVQEASAQSWEGYTEQEVYAIHKFLTDYFVAVDNGLGQEGA